MENVKIKICDVRELEVAQYCEEQGVNFIGIHQIKYPLTQEKKKLVNEIKSKTTNLKLVLVTQEEDLNKLLKMCLECDWDYIQLHFKISPEEIIKLQTGLKRNFSNVGIISVVDISNLEEYDVNMLSKVSEFLLFDSSIRGGTGVPSSIEALKKISKIANGINFFIAGGLNDKNVLNVINICKPYAVDVQSGVEFLIPELKHKKDPKRIKSFVDVVKTYNKQQHIIEKSKDDQDELEI